MDGHSHTATAQRTLHGSRVVLPLSLFLFFFFLSVFPSAFSSLTPGLFLPSGESEVTLLLDWRAQLKSE